MITAESVPAIKCVYSMYMYTECNLLYTKMYTSDMAGVGSEWGVVSSSKCVVIECHQMQLCIKTFVQAVQPHTSLSFRHCTKKCTKFTSAFTPRVEE